MFEVVRDAAIVLVIATIIQMIVLKLKYGVIEKQQKSWQLLSSSLVCSLPISMKSNIYNGKSPLLMPLCHCFIGCTIPIQYATGEKVIRQRNPITR